MKKSLKLLFRKFFKNKQVDPVYGNTPDYSKGDYYISPEGQIRTDLKCSCGCGEVGAIFKVDAMVGIQINGYDFVGLLLKEIGT